MTSLPSLLPQPLAFMGFGFTEILLVGFVALLVFGGNLPEVMRQLGQAYGKFRRSLHEISKPVREEMRQVRQMPAPAKAPTSYGETGEDEGDGDRREDEPPDDEPPDDADPSPRMDDDDDDIAEPPPV